MKSSHSSEYDEQDREIIQLLKELGSLKSTYPSELLTARREAFLAQVERLSPVELDEELSAEDQKFLKLLENLEPVQAEYPPHLLAARRSAFLRQLERAKTTSVWDQLRDTLQRWLPTSPLSGLMRISLVIGSLIAAVLIGSLFFPRAELSFSPSLSQVALEPTNGLPTSTSEVAIAICKPDEKTPSCPTGELDPSQDLANSGNGVARPAVSKDARSYQGGAHMAAYVNDGRSGESWVSNSADSWIKIDLGKVTTFNTVSLQKGSLGPSHEDDPGQFVIAVALSDVYADGDSSHDYSEYAQVFHSEETDFSGSVSQTEIIQTWFPPVQARYVKITFEKAGAAIEEVGVFMVQPPVLAEQPTRTPQEDLPGSTSTSTHTNTPSPMDTATLTPTSTRLPTDTMVPTFTKTPTPSVTPSRLPTNTQPPVDTSTPVHTDPVPTVIPATAVPATLQPSPASTGSIIVTGSNQTLTFTCNGAAAEIRGHANTVTLLGSCSSITVTGNGNRVYWEFGSPLITNKGKDNIIQQL